MKANSNDKKLAEIVLRTGGLGGSPIEIEKQVTVPEGVPVSGGLVGRLPSGELRAYPDWYVKYLARSQKVFG